MITGVDVSAWQEPPKAPRVIDWPAAIKAGVSFASIKATEGTGYVDPTYATDMAAARAAGVPVLFAMHFLWPGQGAAQADHFVATVGKAALADLGVLLDVEKNGSGTWPHYADVDDFIARLVNTHGFTRPGVIYTGGWFWGSRSYLGNPKASWGWPLWDSRYTAPAGLSLAAGASAAGIDWTPGYGGWSESLIVQFTDAASVSGISTRVDGDAFRGSVADLRAALGLLPETSTEADVIVSERPKFEDWQPNGTNGVYRAMPVRSGPVLGRVAAGTIVRTECEVTTDDPANSDWRRSRQPINTVLTTVYLLRSDWTPLVQNGDPAVDAAGEAFMARQPADCSASTAPLLARIAAAKTALG